MNLALLSWPAERAGDALLALASAARLARVGDSGLADSRPTADCLDDWLEWMASQAGVGIESIDSPLPDLPALLARCAPAILKLRAEGGPRLLLVVASGTRGVTLLAPDLSRQRVPAKVLRDALCAPLEAPYLEQIAQLLESAAVPMERRPEVGTALLRERLSAVSVGG